MLIFNRIKEFDVYSKPLDDFRVRTFAGGAMTIICGIIILTLFVTETLSFLSSEIEEHLYVDVTSGEQHIDINFDIRFLKLPCILITVDVMDASGDNQQNIEHDVYKQRIDLDGKDLSNGLAIKQEVNSNLTDVQRTEVAVEKCGSCYGATDGCCNTCEQVKEAYYLRGWQILGLEHIEQCKSSTWIKNLEQYKNEGCRIFGKVQVAKVAGNFHIAPGDPVRSHYSHFHDLHSTDPGKFDTSHIINHLSFGQTYPGKTFPLDGHMPEADKDSHGIMFQYYLKVVPTIYIALDSNREVHSYQYSVFINKKDTQIGISGLPGFFVQYEFSPLMVKYTEKEKSLSSFLVSLCAIIGGIFTVASLIDSFIYRSSKILQKIELSKHF